MTDHLTPAEQAAIADWGDHEHRTPTNEELAAVIRHPDTLPLIRGICRMALVSRKAAGEDIPNEWLDL